MIELKWTENWDKPTSRTREDRLTSVSLFAGKLEDEIAWLYPSRKGVQWFAAIWLPGLDLPVEHAPLETLKSLIETRVQAWFALALGRVGEKPVDNPKEPL